MRKSDVGTANVSVSEIPAPASAIDVKSVLFAMQAVRAGDFSVRLPGDRTGLDGKFSDTSNAIVDTCERRSRELKQVGQTVGREGKTQRRAKFSRSAAPGGRWRPRSIR